MMHGNPVERFDPRQFGKLVNQARCKQDFRSTAGGAVGADKLEPFATGLMPVTGVLRTETDL